MDILNIIFGLIGIVSFIFSIYTYLKTESKKVVEAAKNAIEKERIRNIRIAVQGIFNSTDAIVQIPKRGPITIEQLQDIARLTRGQVFLLMKHLEMTHTNLKEWKFGELVESDFELAKLQKEPQENVPDKLED